MEAMVDVFEEMLNKMDTTILEATVEQQEVPKEEAAVQTIGTLVDQHGDWHLAAGHHP